LPSCNFFGCLWHSRKTHSLPIWVWA